MKSRWIVLGASLLFGARALATEAHPTLVVSTYDSFVAKGGVGPELFSRFERRCECKVKVLASGDAAQLLSRLQLDAERGKAPAHVVLGLDQVTWRSAKPYLEDWGSWRPKGIDRLVPEARDAYASLGPGFLPVDYGVFAFMADLRALKERKLEIPKKLADLLKPEWKRQVILQDPRTSTPGLAFVLYADAVGGPGFWPRFKSQWLTLAPGWSGAYGLFLKKEAPLVWSYTTSQAYHQAHGDSEGRYRAFVFGEGNPIQVEGASLVKGAGSAAEKKLAREFLEFLLTREAQALIPELNWMFPAVSDAPLPASFKSLPKPSRIVRVTDQAKAVEETLSRWKNLIGGSP